tara:strand:+ start:661 stop:825 length:165 start_codon:yes stop_codon:yes gene_type:complete
VFNKSLKLRPSQLDNTLSTITFCFSLKSKEGASLSENPEFAFKNKKLNKKKKLK